MTFLQFSYGGHTLYDFSMPVRLPPRPHVESVTDPEELFYATLKHLDDIARVVGGKAWLSERAHTIEDTLSKSQYVDEKLNGDDDLCVVETSETGFSARKVRRPFGNGTDVGFVFRVSFSHTISTDMEKIPQEHHTQIIEHFLNEIPEQFEDVPRQDPDEEYEDSFLPTEASDYEPEAAFDACCAATLGRPDDIFESRNIEFILDEHEQYFEYRRTIGYLILGKFVEVESLTHSVEPSIVPVGEERMIHIEECIPVGEEITDATPDREKTPDCELGETCLEEAFLEIIGISYGEDETDIIGWPHHLGQMLRLARKVAKKHC